MEVKQSFIREPRLEAVEPGVLVAKTEPDPTRVLKLRQGIDHQPLEKICKPQS